MNFAGCIQVTTALDTNQCKVGMIVIYLGLALVLFVIYTIQIKAILEQNFNIERGGEARLGGTVRQAESSFRPPVQVAQLL